MYCAKAPHSYRSFIINN